MAEGALEEVRRLAERRLDPPCRRCERMACPGLIAHLRGEMSIDDAVSKGQRDTRAYAKPAGKPGFRHQMPGFVATSPADALATLSALVQP